DAATARAVLSRSIPPPSALDSQVTKDLDAIVLRALERDPSARFETAEEFLSTLEKVPLAVATARSVGECVREHGGAQTVEWESGSFRSSSPRPSTLPLAEPRPPEEPVEIPLHVEEATVDPPTSHFKTPKALIAATSPEPEALDMARVRRL